jgi:hypothetical protein
MRVLLFFFVGFGFWVMRLELRRRPRRWRLFSGRRPSLRRHRRHFTADERAAILEACGGRCFYCGVDLHYMADCDWVGGCNTCFEADHYIAAANGGPTTVANGVAACRFHNRGKGAKTAHEYINAGRRRW